MADNPRVVKEMPSVALDRDEAVQAETRKK